MVQNKKTQSLFLIAGLIGSVCLSAPAFAAEAEYERGLRDYAEKDPKYRGISMYQERSSQSAAENYDVRNRARPEYDPIGVRAGSFIFFPELGVSERYDDNIFLSKGNKDTDFITEISPQINLRSNFSRHALNFNAGTDINFYAENNDENHENYYAAFDGRLDATQNFNVTFGANYGILTEDRILSQGLGAIGSSGERVEYDQGEYNATLNGKLNRFRSALGYTYQTVDYDDTFNPTTSASVDQDFRDYDAHNFFGRTNYDFSPGYSAFIEGLYNIREYKDVAGGQAARDSDGYNAYVGMEAELTNLVTGEFKVGYLERFYDFGGYSDVSGLAYGAALNWYPTPLLTARFSAEREVVDAAFLNVSGVLQDTYALEADYELRRNIIVTPYVSYSNGEYEGVDNTQKTVRAGLKGDYLINNNFSLNLGYGYTSREASSSSATFSPLEFQRNLITAGFKAKI